MFSKKMLQAMNDQIQHEFYSAYIYLSMSAYFELENYPGFAHWMRIQFEEEMAHAFRFYDYIHSRGEQVTLLPIGQPPVDYESPLAAFEAALEHEQKITGDIHRLYALATDEKDYPSLSFLQWFIDEQVEEEEHVGEVVDNVKRVSGVSHAMLMLDRELGQRQPPAEVEGE